MIIKYFFFIDNSKLFIKIIVYLFHKNDKLMNPNKIIIFSFPLFNASIFLEVEAIFFFQTFQNFFKIAW